MVFFHVALRLLIANSSSNSSIVHVIPPDLRGQIKGFELMRSEVLLLVEDAVRVSLLQPTNLIHHLLPIKIHMQRVLDEIMEADGVHHRIRPFLLLVFENPFQ
ncbi:hypothetical protein V2J09_016183 [Rumex salicifolius]